ncbi:MAG: hypothetical protein RL417_392 [Pseudomonadota bacterium]|jgi:flagellar hook-basal body complex protein FliE
MALDAIKTQLSAIAPLKPATPGVSQTAPSGTSKSFAEEFMSAVKEVDKMQLTADRKIEDLTMKKDGVTTHEAMIALEKADIAFQLMTSIKSKIIRAYEEVMRTQV